MRRRRSQRSSKAACAPPTGRTRRRCARSTSKSTAPSSSTRGLPPATSAVRSAPHRHRQAGLRRRDRRLREADVEVAFPEQSPLSATCPIVMFNGGVRGARTLLLPPLRQRSRRPPPSSHRRADPRAAKALRHPRAGLDSSVAASGRDPSAQSRRFTNAPRSYLTARPHRSTTPTAGPVRRRHHPQGLPPVALHAPR